MSKDTTIEWAHHTFNPWSGCAKISAGCTHCYAAALPPAMRRGAEWGAQTPRIPASDAYWREPLAWNRAALKAGGRRRVFCASTADVFEDRADLDPWRERLWELIRGTPELDWLLLTKRPRVMARWAATHDWPSNAWAGTSVEDQRAADERIPHLLRVPARVRFLSMEPLLGPVRFDAVPVLAANYGYDANPLDWVIVGGESGRHSRPMHPDWARGLRDQCVQAGVPFFFKQWGEWAPMVPYDPEGPAPQPHQLHGWSDGHISARVGKAVAGRILDGRTWDEVPPCSR